MEFPLAFLVRKKKYKREKGYEVHYSYKAAIPKVHIAHGQFKAHLFERPHHHITESILSSLSSRLTSRRTSLMETFMPQGKRGVIVLLHEQAPISSCYAKTSLIELIRDAGFVPGRSFSYLIYEPIGIPDPAPNATHSSNVAEHSAKMEEADEWIRLTIFP